MPLMAVISGQFGEGPARVPPATVTFERMCGHVISDAVSI
jgi:hypothetical protein